MNNKEILFELQEFYLATRSNEDLSALMVEVEKLTNKILISLLAENNLNLSTDRREVVRQTALLYMIKKFSAPEFRIKVSFYSLIRLHLVGALFDQEARKERNIIFLPPQIMARLVDGEYTADQSVMPMIIKELEKRPEIKEPVNNILDSGKSFESQLYKIKPKALRLKVRDFMIEMKDRIYVSNEYL